MSYVVAFANQVARGSGSTAQASADLGATFEVVGQAPLNSRFVFSPGIFGPIPEPANGWMMGLGLIGLIAASRVKRSSEDQAAG